MALQFPELNYTIDALAPLMSQEQMEFHHLKHHRAYFDNLCKMVEGTPMADMPLEDIIKQAEGGLFNNAAQLWNHTFFFTQFSTSPKAEPQGELLEAIEGSFGSFGSMKEQLSDAAIKLFGSGWVWLVVDGDGLSIVSTSNADTPVKDGRQVLLCVDVWEHAYYIDHRNARAKFLEAFWQMVDWAVIEDRCK